MRKWQQIGLQLAIYSSGSVKAQKLLFGQTEHGNLLAHIDAHFDTAIGHKQEMASYVNISRELDVASNDILFLTDIVKGKICTFTESVIIKIQNSFFL